MSKTGDPFFQLGGDPEWNACIGRQATEEHYVDGYIEAAIALASSVIEKRLYGQRDTLAMPILYNARHGLELALKLAINWLHEMGALSGQHPKNHDILSHWDFLDQAKVGDVAVRQLVGELKRYVESLAKIDDDGQELRYAENRAGGKSLEDKSLANIVLIRDSVIRLGDAIDALKYRLMQLAQERATGTFTPDCSRSDLIAIADRLPPADQWQGAAFDEAKASIMSDFGLSGRKFSAAVDAIKSSRETRRRIGQSTDLKHLTDAHVLFALKQWALCNTDQFEAGGLGRDDFASRNLRAAGERQAAEKYAIAAVIETLTLDEIADLEAVYQIGRHNHYTEHYDKILSQACDRRRLGGDDLWEAVHYLVQKTNLRTAVTSGLSILGRPDLAEYVESVSRDASMRTPPPST